MTTKMLAKFRSFVNKNTANGCWEWTGKIANSTGYGGFYCDGKTHGAHRLSWSLANKKEIPRGAFVCHHCDNRKCVRPSHLYVGNIFTNNQDMVSRNRYPKGANHRRSKVTEIQVGEIRDKYWAGARLFPLSEEYGISISGVSSIIKGRTWAHIPLPEGLPKSRRAIQLYKWKQYR